jgi:glyoxylase-like metal-dependent hydrolase (beta-lactamase superfamily II)
MKFNDYCYQIDIRLWSLPKQGAAYAVQSKKTALIDAGSAHTVKDIQKALNSLKIDIAEIDYMIITHEHYEHGAGAAPLLEKMPKAKVYASEPTSKVLRQPKEIYEKTLRYYGDGKALVSPYPPVNKEVNIVKEGDKLDLGNGVGLEVIDFKGHTPGSIGLLENKTKTLFAGDAVCVYNERTDFSLPPSYPDLFDYEPYQNSLKKMSALNFDYLCMGHFGTLKQPKARQVIKKASEIALGWKEIVTKTYRETGDEDKVVEALRAKYGNGIQKNLVGQFIKGYLMSLKLA